MFSMKKEKRFRSSPKKNIAFYISLALCIAAVAGAAWNTYGSIDEYVRPAEESSKTEVSDTLEAANEVSGEKYESRAEEEASDAPSQPGESSSEGNTEKSSPESVSTAETAAKSAPKVSKPIEKGDVIKKYSPSDPIRSDTMNDWRPHSGVDISGGEGSPVHAVLSGRVSSMYNDPMLGNVIEITSNGGYTLRYCGVTNTSIAKEGSEVTAGETIGYIGVIPCEAKDEAHLHLEAELNGETVDPTILY